MSPTVGVWNGYKTIVWAVRCGDIAGSLTRRLQLQRVVFLLEVYGVCLVGDYGSHGGYHYGGRRYIAAIFGGGSGGIDQVEDLKICFFVSIERTKRGSAVSVLG